LFTSDQKIYNSFLEVSEIKINIYCKARILRAASRGGEGGGVVARRWVLVVWRGRCGGEGVEGAGKRGPRRRKSGVWRGQLERGAGGQELFLHHRLHEGPVRERPSSGAASSRSPGRRELLLAASKPPERAAEAEEHPEQDEDDEDYHRKVGHGPGGHLRLGGLAAVDLVWKITVVNMFTNALFVLSLTRGLAVGPGAVDPSVTE
jgi:hypothetical protein